MVIGALKMYFARDDTPKTPVTASADLNRILSIPTRNQVHELPGGTWHPLLNTIDPVEVTKAFRTPAGTMTLFPMQAKALVEAARARGMVGRVPTGRGKCVAGDTEVFDGTKRRTVEELVGSTFQVVTKDEKHQIVFRPATAFSSGVKRCVRLTLKNGTSVTLSEDHPVLTDRGWVPASQVQGVDLIATPRQVPEPESTISVSDDEVVMAAYLIADGSVSQASTGFSKCTPSIVKEFVAIAERLSDASQNLGKGWKLEGVRSKGNDKDYSLRGMTWFRRKWDINGLSKHKRAPAAFWALPTRQVALFVNRFWSCDGSVNSGVFECTLASEKLIDDLQFLLKRLGIRSSKHYKQAKCQTGVFDAWRLSCSGADAVKFLDRVGLLLGKEHACQKTLIALKSTKRNTNYDVVPVGWREWCVIRESIPKGGGRYKAEKFLGPVNAPHRRQLVSRGKFERFCKEFQYTGSYAWLAESGYVWEGVESLADAGEKSVFDLSVPSTGCFVGNNVILHNTLISLLLPKALDLKRALLLIPSALRGSLDREIKKYTPHFELPLDRIVRVMTHQELSLPSSTALLDELQPDGVIVDEVDAFANRESVRTDRLFKYGRKHSLKWGVESGTLFQKSVKDALYWFALVLRERSPLPLHRSEIETWVDVLDPIGLGENQRDPGALRKLCNPGETPRQAWNRRAALTVGVITSDDKRLGVALYIHERLLEMPESLKESLKQLEKTWTRPDGKEFSMALDLRRLERQISAGFYYRWEQEPEPEWVTKRNGWEREKRERMKGIRRVGMDSPKLIEEAAERADEIALLESGEVVGAEGAPDFDEYIKELKKLPHFESTEWRAWKTVKEVPEPQTVPVILSDYLHKDAAQWGRENVGIIWCLHEFTGRSIAELGGFPYFGAGDDTIMDEDGTRTIVASLRAHGIGKNLQMFHEMLLTELPSSGHAFEQMIAREHREGQLHHEVNVTVYRHCPAYKRAWATAIRKAYFMQDMNGNDQKLLYATCIFGEDQGAALSLAFTVEELEAMDALANEDDDLFFTEVRG